jgi:hypothetical protein
MRLPLRVAAIIMLVCPLFIGCFTNFYLTSPLDANQKQITDHAEVILRSGVCIEAVDIKVGSDTTRFVLMGTDSLRQIRTNDIDKLSVKDHAAGTIGGYLSGGAIGLGAGILLSSWTGELKRQEGSMAPVIYMAGGLVTGSIGGAIYWGMRGHHDNYIFPSDSITGVTER